MKKFFPAWILVFPLLLTGFLFYCGYINEHKNSQTQTLKTLFGSPETLDGITVTLDTILSDDYDTLTTKIALGDSIKSVSTFENGFGNDRFVYFQNHQPYSIDERLKAPKGNSYRSIPFKTISDTVPFYFSVGNQVDEKACEFPYIHLDTPDDLTLTSLGISSNDYEDAATSDYNYNSNYIFYVNMTMPVELDGAFYFSVTGLSGYRDDEPKEAELSYEIEHGIFQYTGDGIVKVYADTPNHKDYQILNLISFSDRHQLGLIVKEGTTVKLKIITPSTNTLEQEITLYEDTLATYPDSSFLEHEEFAYYNASSGTLVVTSYSDQPAIPYSEFQLLEQAYNEEEEETLYKPIRNLMNSSINRTGRLLCYTFDKDNTLTKQMDLDEGTFSTTIEGFYECEDYAYHNDTLYLLGSEYKGGNYASPYLAAVKDHSVIYYGHLETAANEDYNCNRIAIMNYTQRTNDDYSTFLRQMGHFSLSLTN